MRLKLGIIVKFFLLRSPGVFALDATDHIGCIAKWFTCSVDIFSSFFIR